MSPVPPRAPQDAVPLVSARLDLEPLTADHAAALYIPLLDPALYAWIPEPPPVDLAWLTRRYARLEGRRSPDGREAWLNWALRDRATGRYVGYVQATVRLAARDADVAYLLFSPDWGKGYGREAMVALLQWLFPYYGLRHADVRIDPRNRRSLALATALGFVPLRYLPGVDELHGQPADVYVLRLHGLPSPTEASL